MSLLLGLDLGGFGFLISDRSATRDNRSWDADIPKLVKVGGGFMGASGDANAAGVFLAAAQSAAYAKRKPLDDADVLGLAKRVLGLFPPPVSWPADRPRLCSIAMTGRGRVTGSAGETSTTVGKMVRGSRAILPRRSPAREVLGGLFDEIKSTAESFCDVVRIAGLFVSNAHDADARIGLTVDIAVCFEDGQAGCLSGSARELAVSTDRMIMGKVAGSSPGYSLRLVSDAIPADAAEVDDSWIEVGEVEAAHA